ncbi:MAG TPA: hypothetical protein VME63_11480 [Dyella sp.]|uniref:hypothetical protein n=1 Tax=Dyella sp. TaxID=1869338 RepID=UPI002BABF1EF|nr:hypothetical protein [Dyella sp.]HTV86023.1 hypothetical protein [Dyella sp.]
MLAMVFSASVWAGQPPSTGLGQSWPNAADVSVSPHYHVYVFARDGIRYIQVNDLNGTVRGAVAVADHVVLVLPIGADASSVVTYQPQANAQRPNASGETVYRDGTTQISASPQSTGAVQLIVSTANDQGTCTDPFNCTGGNVTGIPTGNSNP